MLAAALAALGTWLLFTGKGDLLITVAGADNAAVSDVSVFVDGTERCSQTPCKLEGLKAGSYTVRAEAAGHVSSAEQAVKVDSGSSTAHHIQLKPTKARPQLVVNATGAGLRVLIDGQDRGAPPAELSDLSPGEHTLRVEGPGYEAVEQTVVVEQGVAQVVGPLNPKLVKGSLRLALGDNAQGASVFVNGKSMRSLPATLELDAEDTHKVLVRKAGYEDFEQTVSFSPAQPKVDLTIELSQADTNAEAAGASRAPRTTYRGSGSKATSATEEAKAEAPTESKPSFLDAIKDEQKDTKETSKAAERKTAAQPAEAKPKAASGTGTLNINSVPPTTVLLNGRPLGKTPKAGVSVPAGSHTITFIHTDKGRKTVKVTVDGGASRTVSVRL